MGQIIYEGTFEMIEGVPYSFESLQDLKRFKNVPEEFFKFITDNPVESVYDFEDEENDIKIKKFFCILGYQKVKYLEID